MKLNHLFLQGCRIFGMGNNREVMMQSSEFKQNHLFERSSMDLPAGKGSFTHLLQGIESDFGCELSLVLCDNLGPIF